MNIVPRYRLLSYKYRIAILENNRTIIVHNIQNRTNLSYLIRLNGIFLQNSIWLSFRTVKKFYVYLYINMYTVINSQTNLLSSITKNKNWVN